MNKDQIRLCIIPFEIHSKGCYCEFNNWWDMIVRDLERVLVEHGAGAAKIDAITRRLREIGRLPKGGRGPNAPTISALDAAAILVALAGSNKGAEADARLQKLEGLRCSSGKPTILLEFVASALEDTKLLTQLREVRVGRTTRRAAVIWADGTVDEYRGERSQLKPSRFYVEGILPAKLLELIASALKAGTTPAARTRTPRQ